MSIKYFPSSLKLTRDTKSNIISTSPAVNTLAYATDTERFYVYDGSDWDAEFLTITENDTRYLKLDGSNANTSINLQNQSVINASKLALGTSIITGETRFRTIFTDTTNTFSDVEQHNIFMTPATSTSGSVTKIGKAVRNVISIGSGVNASGLTGYSAYFQTTASVTSGQTMGSSAGIAGQTISNNAGYLVNSYGLIFYASNTGSGTVDNGTGIFTRVDNYGAGGLLKYARGIRIGSPVATGQIYVNYGLYVDNQTSADFGNYAIYTNLGINRLGDQLFVDGSQNITQQIIQANATQTANLTEWQNSSGTTVSLISSSGDGMRIGSSTSNGALSIGGQAVNQNIAIKIDRVVATPSQTVISGINGEIAISAVGSATQVWGLSFNGKSNHSTGTLNVAGGIQAKGGHTGAGTVTSLYGERILSGENSGGGTVVTNYGLYVEDQSVGGTNYAIYTNAGTVHVGDKIEFTQIDGNEAIDSLADGYMDYLATTAHRFNAPITVPSYERHIQIPVQAVGNPANQPTAIDAGTAGGYQFASSGVQEELHFQWEVPDDWDGTDIKLEIDWLPDSGTKTSPAAVRWVFEYRFIAPGESILQGTQATQSISDTATVAQYVTIHSPVTLPFNDANQPITKQDHLYVRCYRDTTVANDFTGTVIATAFEVIYNSNTLPTNN